MRRIIVMKMGRGYKRGTLGRMESVRGERIRQVLGAEEVHRILHVCLHRWHNEMHQTLRKGGRREKLKHLPCMSKILDWI
jgi:hypothetical protein